MSDIDLSNVRVLTHSAVRIEAADGVVIYLDPFRIGDEPHDADYILITHAHYDHFSPEDIARVRKDDTILVVPASMATEASGLPSIETHFVAAGHELDLPGGRIETVPAYNVEPERLGFHPKGNGWLGYVLDVDGARYFISGDTDRNPDNAQVSCDVAIVPIGGTYTMDPAQAAAYVNEIAPRAVVPTHYGSIVGSMSDADAFAGAVDPSIEVALKLER